MNRRLLEILCTVGYLGKMPKAPGTWGTLAGIPLWFLLSHFTSPLVYMMVTFFFVIFAIVVSDLYERLNAVHDPKEIVIDEVAGYLITMTWMPENWKSIFLGFVAFRFFDILKPWPISYLDKNVKGGVGTVVDDVAAGIAASIVIQVVFNYGFLS